VHQYKSSRNWQLRAIRQNLYIGKSLIYWALTGWPGSSGVITLVISWSVSGTHDQVSDGWVFSDIYAFNYEKP
jgi:hypothetical protein